jgi:formylglycine-generating enzyme required for sulfatase activity
MERLPASVQAMATSGSSTLQAVDQKLDPIRAFLSPQIIQQPSIPAGGGSLSAQAQGLSLTYQWLRNGVPITGQTGTQLSVQGLPSGTYTLVVNNGFASVTSGSVEFGTPTSAPAGFALVTGGTLPVSSPLGAVAVGTFSIGKTEVTWGEWKPVRDWAVANGYTDLTGVGKGVGDNYPVMAVNWYDVVK